VQIANDRPSKQWLYILALLLSSLVWKTQKARIHKQESIQLAEN